MRDSFERGICEESEIPKITVEEYEFIDNSHTLPKKNRTKYSKSFSRNIVIGWKIDSVWADGTNGTWSLNKDPLLSNDIDAQFVSKAWRGQRFRIYVYLMHIPD